MQPKLFFGASLVSYNQISGMMSLCRSRPISSPLHYLYLGLLVSLLSGAMELPHPNTAKGQCAFWQAGNNCANKVCALFNRSQSNYTLTLKKRTTLKKRYFLTRCKHKHSLYYRLLVLPMPKCKFKVPELLDYNSAFKGTHIKPYYWAIE